MNSYEHARERHNLFNNVPLDSSYNNFALMPFDDSLTILDTLKKIPLNSQGKVVDNTFLFMNESNKFYSNLSNRDFYLQVLWKPFYSEDIKKLNDKKDFDFMITKKAKGLH